MRLVSLLHAHNTGHNKYFRTSEQVVGKLLKGADCRAFCDGTRRYGVPAPFFQVKKTQLFVMYIVNE